ncbi:hypothetical protein ACWDUL_33820 [Nocardia niigatensis]
MAGEEMERFGPSEAGEPSGALAPPQAEPSPLLRRRRVRRWIVRWGCGTADCVATVLRFSGRDDLADTVHQGILVVRLCGQIADLLEVSDE